MKTVVALLALAVAALAGPSLADTPEGLIARYAAEAGTAASADRGHAFFLAQRTTGKPATPSCSTCHTEDPRAEGRTRAGKTIAPMAVSKTPTRFTDPEKVEKWFRRNCDTVLGRECTAGEKADIIAYFASL